MLKINLRYFQVFLDYSIRPLNRLRSKGGGLKFLVDKEKWKTSDSPCSIISSNWSKREDIML